MILINNFFKSKKAQVGDTMTWIVAFTIIFFIMIIFLAAVITIFASGNRGPDTSPEGKIVLNVNIAKTLINEDNLKIIYSWADDDYVFNTVNPDYDIMSDEALALKKAYEDKHADLCKVLEEVFLQYMDTIDGVCIQIKIDENKLDANSITITPDSYSGTPLSTCSDINLGPEPCDIHDITSYEVNKLNNDEIGIINLVSGKNRYVRVFAIKKVGGKLT